MKQNQNITVKSVKIKNLFDIFDYNIEYPLDESVLIITGPNGFGKTQILNILYHLFNRKFLFFQNLVFDKIAICFSNDVSIEILKNIQKDKNEVLFNFYERKKKIETIGYTTNIDKNLFRKLENYLPIRRIDTDSWIDHETDKVLSLDEVINKYADNLPNNIKSEFLNIQTKEANGILDSINVHLIREQRLFKKVNSSERDFRRGARDQTIMVETIESYSNELRDLISEQTQKSFVISQNLDSSYPNRLISETKKLRKEEYDKRFANLKEKQDKLMKIGLYENTQEDLEYSKDDAKALLVYLNDLEKKLAVFDNLLEKLELFTNILNERRFTYKSININREKGFFFKTTKDKELKLNQLSSGEQHEVVLLYELIFKTKRNMLVLIDEPEISLHVTWQKEFIADILRIIKIQNFQVLIATHSPSIINDRWDLVYNLEKADL